MDINIYMAIKLINGYKIYKKGVII
jgi:hypothetical protein